MVLTVSTTFAIIWKALDLCESVDAVRVVAACATRLIYTCIRKIRGVSSDTEQNQERMTTKTSVGNKKERGLTRVEETITRHALQCFPGSSKGAILVLIVRNLGENTQRLGVSAGKV